MRKVDSAFDPNQDSQFDPYNLYIQSMESGPVTSGGANLFKKTIRCDYKVRRMRVQRIGLLEERKKKKIDKMEKKKRR